MSKVSVLFVCLGNICRSPTAEAVFRHKVEANNLAQQIEIDSCGTAGYHVGEEPDHRSMKAAAQRGVSMSGLRARQVSHSDFDRFDYILAMDHSNLMELQRMMPTDSRCKLGLFLAYGGSSVQEVPDPYYGGVDGFDKVLDLVSDASDGLLAHLKYELGY